MKYYLIAGEASGDLHGSHLMEAIKCHDHHAEFRFFGGDLMISVGGECVKHYREMAYMGFVPVLLHLPVILRNMRMCKKDITMWHPDVVILIDYPGFNLDIAAYISKNTDIPVHYYIAPKIWAWKEYRIKNIKRDVKELFSILPFEVDFFEKKYHYPIHYVGNPTASEVTLFKNNYNETFAHFAQINNLHDHKPIIAILAGSRRQEIKDNLPLMIRAAKQFKEYQLVLAAAPGIAPEFYEHFIQNQPIAIVYNQTYPLLANSVAALVTSGTATLETALFDVPQVVCYETPLPHLIAFLRKRVLKVKYVSLVNLIADKEVVPELVADSFTLTNIYQHLKSILLGGDARNKMLSEYNEIHQRLGESNAPDNAAEIIVNTLRTR